MLEQVSNFDQDIEFVTGFAGSGKSTELARRANKNTLVMTPTHKAAGVLMAKGVPAYTIHSVLLLVPTINENFRKGQKMQTLKRVGKTDLSSITDVFIDEFSMINEEILDMLLHSLPSHCKVTVFGDPYQLPPVTGTMINPLNYTQKITELTVQHRADNPEIVETFMRFMNFIKSGNNNIDLRVNLPKGTLKDFNPDTDRALAYTNAKVLHINSKIGAQLGKQKDIEVGEEILVNDMVGSLINLVCDDDIEGVAFPKTMSKGKMMEEGAFESASEETLENIENYNTNLSEYKAGGIEIDGKKYQCYYDLNHYEKAKEFKSDVMNYQQLVIDTHGIDDETNLAKWCQSNKGKQYVRQRGLAWSKYMAHQNLVFNVRRPFATTVHKAQGQEFPKVFIAQGDMKKSIRNNYYVTYARLMYVALSRAINEVVIIK